MRPTVHRLTGLLALLAGCQAPTVFAAATPNTCEWLSGGGATMTFNQNMGTVYVPRDAPVGSIIGRRERKLTPNIEGRAVRCDNDGNVRLTFNAATSVPFAQNLPVGIGTFGAIQDVLSTNIPGVGVRFQLGFPFDGFASNSFTPDTGDPTVPFSAHHQRPMGSAQMNFSSLESYITLIKTGPIPLDPQTFDGQELFSGEFSGIPGKTFRAGLSGTVIQAHCGSHKVSADPVQLGDWDLADFNAPGYTTTAVPFSIFLSTCIADDADLNIATAHIRFEGAGGSLPVTPPIPGVFSLTPGSSAKGVGIQILKGDQTTPIELSQDVAIEKISSKGTPLHFAARFYQIEASRDIEAGEAKGTLNFTLTYK
ncbi:fimbrial protein [Pseudomonas sp. C32]|uniref:fimbrial protein n=1 Tax=Pseudomonas sp. C32 TaxID=1529208 RepID=UPI00262C993C|nr:fimbrial protein [Pseudomonas sp. C32]MDN4548020.1 fimbrial protein [Pseudomonas sp. C32]